MIFVRPRAMSKKIIEVFQITLKQMFSLITKGNKTEHFINFGLKATRTKTSKNRLKHHKPSDYGTQFSLEEGETGRDVQPQKYTFKEKEITTHSVLPSIPLCNVPTN